MSRRIEAQTAVALPSGCQPAQIQRTQRAEGLLTRRMSHIGGLECHQLHQAQARHRLPEEARLPASMRLFHGAKTRRGATAGAGNPVWGRRRTHGCAESS